MSWIISPITAQDVADVLDLAAARFAKSSTLHRAMGLDAQAYRAALAPGLAANVAQGLSVLARDGETLLGALVACDLLDQGASGPEPRLRAIHALMHQMEDAYIARTGPAPGEVLLVDMAFVAPHGARRGIYTALRKAAQTRAAARGYTRVVGLLSSAVTQHVVVNRLGHAALAQQRFDGFTFEGQTPFAGITEPEALWLTEGRLT